MIGRMAASGQRGVWVRFKVRMGGQELEGRLVEDRVEYQDVLGIWQVVGLEHVDVLEHLPAEPAH